MPANKRAERGTRRGKPDVRISETVDIFAALGDPTRLRLVARLSSDGPQSIAGLTTGAGVTRQAVTKHLIALADAGLATSSREGRQVVWVAGDATTRKRQTTSGCRIQSVGCRS